MDKADILRIAQDLGCVIPSGPEGVEFFFYPAELERFVALVLAAQPERTLTDEKIAELWHQNGGFHHHFARAVERYLKGEK